jgi:glutamate synthase (NADPH/NADH) small chain
LDIPGEDLNGVLTANEFLTKSNLMQAHKFPEYDTPIHIGERVVVVGGGNVAIDSARTALRFGAKEVTVVYRRSREEMPARREEVENAEEEGIKFQYLATPIRILGNKDSEVTAIECQKMRLGEPGPDGRRTPIPIEGETFIIETPTVIIAIGTEVNPLIQRTTRNLKTNNKGHIIIEEPTGKTSRDLIYAGGDVTTGSDTVIQAMGAGKKAAKAIDLTLEKKRKSNSKK